MRKFINKTDIRGTVVQHFPPKSGTTNNKQWTMYSALLDSGDKCPIVVTAFGQNGEVLATTAIGDWLDVYGRTISRRWEDKYFTQFRVENIHALDENGNPIIAGSQANQHGNAKPINIPAPTPVTNSVEPAGIDDVPF